MTKQQIIDAILSSGNFQWRTYANTHNIQGEDSDEILDNIALHMERMDQEALSLIFEACCSSDVDNWYAEQYGLQPYQQ